MNAATQVAEGGLLVYASSGSAAPLPLEGRSADERSEFAGRIGRFVCCETCEQVASDERGARLSAHAGRGPLLALPNGS